MNSMKETRFRTFDWSRFRERFKSGSGDPPPDEYQSYLDFVTNVDTFDMILDIIDDSLSLLFPALGIGQEDFTSSALSSLRIFSAVARSRHFLERWPAKRQINWSNILLGFVLFSNECQIEVKSQVLSFKVSKIDDASFLASPRNWCFVQDNQGFLIKIESSLP